MTVPSQELIKVLTSEPPEQSAAGATGHGDERGNRTRRLIWVLIGAGLVLALAYAVYQKPHLPNLFVPTAKANDKSWTKLRGVYNAAEVSYCGTGKFLLRTSKSNAVTSVDNKVNSAPAGPGPVEVESIDGRVIVKTC